MYYTHISFLFKGDICTEIERMLFYGDECTRKCKNIGFIEFFQKPKKINHVIHVEIEKMTKLENLWQAANDAEF
jgi:hypothetical protein